MEEYVLTIRAGGVEIRGTHHNPATLAKDMLKLRKKFFHPAAIKAQANPEPLPELPLTLKNYCESWSEEWARDDSKQRAYALWTKHENWELVLQELLKQDGEKIG